jgi:hypothetical protein
MFAGPAGPSKKGSICADDRHRESSLLRSGVATKNVTNGWSCACERVSRAPGSLLHHHVRRAAANDA